MKSVARKVSRLVRKQGLWVRLVQDRGGVAFHDQLAEGNRRPGDGLLRQKASSEAAKDVLAKRMV